VEKCAKFLLDWRLRSTNRPKKYFLSVAGAGPDGMIVYSIDLELKARVGIMAYWWQGAREAFRYKFSAFALPPQASKSMPRSLSSAHQALRRSFQDHHRRRPL
jgi:hypothetical protein